MREETAREPLRTLGLFEGIGGIALGLERAEGFRHIRFCEIESYCQAVLRKHWPDVPIHDDVRTLHASPGEYDVITGGFPCQPVSLAGRRKGQADERWLWPEFARLVGEARPRYVLVENVRGLCSKGLPEVLAGLAGLGYDAEWQVVSAAAVGAPHLRERVLLVAYPERLDLRVEPRRCGRADGEGPALAGLDGTPWTMADADDTGRGPNDSRRRDLDRKNDGLQQGRKETPSRPGVGSSEVAYALGGGCLRWAGEESKEEGRTEPEDRRAGLAGHWAAEPDVGRVAHGIPGRVDRLRALGNAVVPQVAEFVGGLILEHHERSLETEEQLA